VVIESVIGVGRRIRNRSGRRLAQLFFRRPLHINTTVPYISFTFDDFPRSALHDGGEILRQYGLKATYYASFGLMGSCQSTGPMFLESDVRMLLQEGHELGSHTYDHSNPSLTDIQKFEKSIHQNQLALVSLIPGAIFRTFAYPISTPRLYLKKRVGEQFDCCRAGGQSYNGRVSDLNLLKAFFLEKTKGGLNEIEQIILKNAKALGWLILVTHDISDSPSPYGCTPRFFKEVVKCAVDSGAVILPVAKTLDALFLAKLV